MVWFHCFGCTRGELKEKSYDHRRPNGWLNMWVSSSNFCSVLSTYSSDRNTDKIITAVLFILFTPSSELPLKHRRHMNSCKHTHTQTDIQYIYCILRCIVYMPYMSTVMLCTSNWGIYHRNQPDQHVMFLDLDSASVWDTIWGTLPKHDGMLIGTLSLGPHLLSL